MTARNSTEPPRYLQLKTALDQAAVEHIAQALGQVLPAFDQQGFIARAVAPLAALELKARVAHLSQTLYAFLPGDFEAAAQTLHNLKQAQTQGNCPPIQGFTAWPLIDYVGHYGQAHPHTALPLLASLTSLHTAEFAIRPFIEHQFDLTYPYLQRWCDSDDPHVRRLVSEGTRTRLPWARQLPRLRAEPQPVLALLERLKRDAHPYVRRSVANNLNDLSKDHPQRILSLCRNWLQPPGCEDTAWIVRHATRTLVKQGDAQALALLGYHARPQCTTELVLSPAHIQLGKTLQLTLHIASGSDTTQPLWIDYAVHFMRANGSHSRKVFRFKTLSLTAGAETSLQKSHSFAPRTTRRYYSGPHRVEILVNGQPAASAEFELRL